MSEILIGHHPFVTFSYFVYVPVLLLCLFFTLKIIVSREWDRLNGGVVTGILSAAGLLAVTAYFTFARKPLSDNYVICLVFAVSPVFFTRLVRGKGRTVFPATVFAAILVSVLLSVLSRSKSGYGENTFDVGWSAITVMAGVLAFFMWRIIWRLGGVDGKYDKTIFAVDTMNELCDILYFTAVFLLSCIGRVAGSRPSWVSLSCSFVCLALVSVLIFGLFLRRRDGRVFLIFRDKENKFMDACGISIVRPLKDGVRLNENYEFLYTRVLDYFEKEKPFLDPDLTLEKVAKTLLTNKQYLSNTINRLTGNNFSKFVNGYRVSYALKLFQQNCALKVVDLAMSSGFHTLHSFTLAFKLVMNISPSKWCKLNRNLPSD